MRLIWSKSKSPVSWLIRQLTGDDCSHFSIVLYDGSPWQIMFESNLLGTHPAFYQTFLKTHSILHEKKISCSMEEEDATLAEIIDFYDGCSYDYKGALYLGIRKWLSRVFKIKVPEKNKWSDPAKYYCEELIVCVRKIKEIPSVPTANAMRTPHDLWGYFQ